MRNRIFDDVELGSKEIPLAQERENMRMARGARFFAEVKNGLLVPLAELIDRKYGPEKVNPENLSPEDIINQSTEKFLDFSLESFESAFDEPQDEVADKLEECWEAMTSDYSQMWNKLLEEDGVNAQVPADKYATAERFHAAYVAGEFWRAAERAGQSDLIQGGQEAVTQAFLDVWRSGVSGAELLNALEERLYLGGGLASSEHGMDLQDSFLRFYFTQESNEWGLSRLSNRPLEVVMNHASIFAARATQELAVEIGFATKQNAAGKLLELCQRPSAELEALLADTSDSSPERILILTALQSANLTWIMSKPYQAVVEASMGKFEKGKSRLVKGHLLPFDIMAIDKKWEAVLMDLDQIRVGLTILQERQAHAEQTEPSTQQ